MRLSGLGVSAQDYMSRLRTPSDKSIETVLAVMRLRLVREPFDHPDYIFELKHGFWAIAYLQNGECRLVSRNQRTLGFDALKRSLAKLPAQTAILDGEIICLDAKGVSQFNQLLSRKVEPILYAFDLLWLDGEDLRHRQP